MDSCSSVTTRNCSLVPSGEIGIIGSVSTVLPCEIWRKVFSYLGFQDLKLSTEYKIKVLKKPLDGSEDNDRLVIGDKYIMEKENFLHVVKTIYNVARCCKELYAWTERERKLLINCAQRARLDPRFFSSTYQPSVIGPTLMLSVSGPPPRFSPPDSPPWFSPPDRPSLLSLIRDQTRHDNRCDIGVSQFYAQLCESTKSFKIEPVKLELDGLFTLPLLDIDIFKKIKATEGPVDENQIGLRDISVSANLTSSMS